MQKYFEAKVSGKIEDITWPRGNTNFIFSHIKVVTYRKIPVTKML